MRIAYFTDTYLPQINGVSNTLEKLGDYLTKQDIKHMFFAPQYQEELGFESNSPVVRFKSISLPFYPECRISIPIYANLCRLADKFKPDIVHLTDPLGIGLAGLRYARDRGIPIVASFHTNFDAYLKYYNLEYLEVPVWGLFKWFHGFGTINFCPSQDTLQVLASKGIENLSIWARGVDTEKYNPSRRSPAVREQLKSKNKISFLYVGRLAAEKDLDILMNAIDRVNSCYAGQVQFVFVGDGPLAKSMKDRAQDNVVFTGYLRNEELSAVYASCDVFVFPSSTETFGNVVLEAMASGLPVIAVNAGGVKDNVFHEYNGLICVPRDADSLAEAIVQVAKDKKLRDTLTANALSYAEMKSWNKIFDQLVASYAKVLQQAKLNVTKTA